MSIDPSHTTPAPPIKPRLNSRLAPLSGPDFYPTPFWATYALLHHETFPGTIWEPACGDGSISEVLKTKYDPVNILSTDLHDTGYGTPNVDFLRPDNYPPFDFIKDVDCIITNPPYKLAEEFVWRAVQQANKKVALLLRLQFLESKSRASNLFKIIPPSRVWIFPERVNFYPKGYQPPPGKRLNATPTACAWYVWDLKEIHVNHTDRPAPSPALHWFDTGFKARYRNIRHDVAPATSPSAPEGEAVVQVARPAMQIHLEDIIQASREAELRQLAHGADKALADLRSKKS